MCCFFLFFVVVVLEGGVYFSESCISSCVHVNMKV